MDVSSTDLQRIVSTLDRKYHQDAVLDFIISSKLHREISEQLLYPKKFQFIKNLIDTQDVPALKDYLDKKWYKSMKQTYWFDNHKNKNEIFFGYWSFESAVVIKILNLDDKILMEQQYYPFDFIHSN